MFATYGCEGTLCPTRAADSLATELASAGGVNTAAGTEERLAVNSTVRAWVSGHTHYNCSHVVHGTLIVSNQKGYELWGHKPEGGPPYRNDATVTLS